MLFALVRKNRIALAPPFAHNLPMLARVLSAAVNGIEAFPVEVEVNCGWEDTVIVVNEEFTCGIFRDDGLLPRGKSRLSPHRIGR